MKTITRLVALGCITAALPASAQTGNQSDVTGVATTGSTIAGGAFAPSPGQVATTATPAVQAAVAQASATVAAQLSTGTMTTPTGIAIPAAAQQAVAAVMTTNVVNTTAGVALAAELGGNTAAAALVESVTGLLTSPAPGQFASAIGNLNALIDAAPVEFLANPPPGFLAIQASLAAMVQAANAAQARAGVPSRVARAPR
jgi:hypothetical protein